MRNISVDKIYRAVYDGTLQANFRLPFTVKTLIRRARNAETSGQARQGFDCIIANFIAAEKETIPICQDTGLTVVMIEIGQSVRLTGGDLRRTVDKAVADATKDGHLRASVVSDPLIRANTGTNTPCVLHTSIVPGEKIRITVMPKGGGAENMSFVRMLPPSVTREEIEDIVVESVRKAGTNPCPPVVVGIGLGGNFEQCAMLAKKALLREKPNRDKNYGRMEKSVKKKIDKLKIGPQVPGGGKTTALAVRIETAACHIASLPLAVNINCHVSRWKKIII